MIEIDQTTLDTGLPVVKLKMPGTRAMTALVAFDAGARTEHADENGMAHFLEHLVFKGGEKYSSYRDVNETAERLGAQLNAYTSHDVVAFHITARAESLMPAVDLLTDFVARARIDGEELDRERGVVIQEINRYYDQPNSVADIPPDPRRRHPPRPPPPRRPPARPLRPGARRAHLELHPRRDPLLPRAPVGA